MITISPYVHEDEPQTLLSSPAATPQPLLEYRAEADPDEDFVARSVAGFTLGGMAFGFCINFVDSLYNYRIGVERPELVHTMLVRGAFMLGIMCVACSLLLVGLKVRADHSPVPLFSRHWLNSITTGGFYATLIWCPWILIEHGFALHTNRFLASVILMA